MDGYDNWKTRAPEDDADTFDWDAWEAELERRAERDMDRWLP